MLLNTTYDSRDDKALIEDLVGKPYTLVQKLRLGGIGSKRMVIDEVSPNLGSVLNTVSDINYASIELRPKGILIRITKGLKNFTWIIPFYQLVIYKVNGSSIHAQGKFIHFKANKTFKENKKFFNKLLDHKVRYDLQYSAPAL